MATSNSSRDVRLGIAVDVDGGGVKQLATDIRGIGDAAGQSAPGVDKLTADLAQLNGKREELHKAELDARSDAAAASAVLAEQKAALALLRAETDNATKKTTEYAASERAAKVAIEEAKAALRDKAAAVKSAAAESNAAIVAEQKLTAQLAEIARLAGLAGKSLDAAFTQTGARSTAAIQADLRAVDEALSRIAQDARTTGADFDRAFAASRSRVQQLNAELAATSPTIDRAARSTSLLSDSLRQAAVYFSAFTVGKSFIDANVQLEALRRTLALVTGSTETAAKQIEFLRKTADESGAAVGSITQAYTKFVASAGAAGISLDTVNRTFAAVTKAAGNLGLSSDETSAALLALGQSASKGKVSMEELGQQLGDRLPAVLATTAKGLGITTAEMVKLITSGELLADNSFFAAFSQGIEQTFVKGATKVSGFRAELGRLQNTYNAFLTSLGDAGVLSALTATLTLFGPIVTGVGAAFITLGKAIGTVAGATVDLGGKLVTLDFSGLVSGLRQGRDAARELTDEFQRKTGGVFNVLDVFGIASKKTADSTAALGSASKDAGGKIADMAAASGIAGKAQADLGAATAAGSAQAVVASDRWVALTVAYNKLIEKSAQSVEESTKLEKAKRTEGAAAVALAELAGNEVGTREAVSAAAEGNAKAIQAVAAAKQSEADLTQIKIGALRQEAIDTNSLTDARKAELVELEQKLKGLKAEASAANEAAEAAKIEAAARALAIKLVQDNSGALVALKAAYEDARKELTATIAEEAKGQATADQLNAARRRLAAAEALYHDALDDTSAALGRKIERQKLDLDVTQAKLSLEKATLQSQLDLATLSGNDALALDARIKLKQLEIKVIEAKVAATKLEAQATIAKTQADKAALEAEGKLTDAARLAIDAAIAGAKVKLLEAEAQSQQTKVLAQQIANLQTYGTEAGRASEASGRLTASFGVNTGAARDNAAAIIANKLANGEALTAAEALAAVNIRLAGSFNSLADAARNASVKSVLGTNTYDKDGFATGSDGQRINLAGQAKVGDGEYFDAAAYARDAARATTVLDPQRYVKKDQGSATAGSAASIVAAELARLDEVKKRGNGSASGSSGFGTVSAPTPAPAPAGPTVTPSSTSHTVEIKLQGTGLEKYQSTLVSMSTQADADSLVRMLKTLDNAARSAGGGS